MFAAVSLPSPRRFLNTRWSLSDRLSNMTAWDYSRDSGEIDTRPGFQAVSYYSGCGWGFADLPTSDSTLLQMLHALRGLSMLGPVPPGGTGTLPGAVLCGLGFIGLFALPAKIKKVKSKESPSSELAFTAAIDFAFIIGGLLMLFNR
jgi:hypothetical protein